MANKKFNFKTPLLGATGQPIKDQAGDVMLNVLLSNLIMGSTVNDATSKFFDWAVDLAKDGELQLDGTDQETLTRFIKESKFTVLVTQRLLDVLQKA